MAKNQKLDETPRQVEAITAEKLSEPNCLQILKSRRHAAMPANALRV